MVAGSLPAGSLTLSLIDPDLANHTPLAAAVGAGWFLMMLLVVLGGARLTVRAQLVMSGVEMLILIGFVLAAVLHRGHATAFDWSWFGLGQFDGPQGFAAGALIAGLLLTGAGTSPATSARRPGTADVRRGSPHSSASASSSSSSRPSPSP
ncbi:putative amino acid permease [Streptomyces narbonensis]